MSDVSSVIEALIKLLWALMGKWAEVTSRVYPADPAALDTLQKSVERDPRFNDPIYKKKPAKTDRTKSKV